MLLLLVVPLEAFVGKILRLERILQTVIHLPLAWGNADDVVVLGQFVPTFGASSAPSTEHANYSADRLGDDAVAVIDALTIIAHGIGDTIDFTSDLFGRVARDVARQSENTEFLRESEGKGVTIDATLYSLGLS